MATAVGVPARHSMAGVHRHLKSAMHAAAADTALAKPWPPFQEALAQRQQGAGDALWQSDPWAAPAQDPWASASSPSSSQKSSPPSKASVKKRADAKAKQSTPRVQAKERGSWEAESSWPSSSSQAPRSASEDPLLQNDPWAGATHPSGAAAKKVVEKARPATASSKASSSLQARSEPKPKPKASQPRSEPKAKASADSSRWSEAAMAWGADDDRPSEQANAAVVYLGRSSEKPRDDDRYSRYTQDEMASWKSSPASQDETASWKSSSASQANYAGTGHRWWEGSWSEDRWSQAAVAWGANDEDERPSAAASREEVPVSSGSGTNGDADERVLQQLLLFLEQPSQREERLKTLRKLSGKSFHGSELKPQVIEQAIEILNKGKSSAPELEASAGAPSSSAAPAGEAAAPRAAAEAQASKAAGPLAAQEQMLSSESDDQLLQKLLLFLEPSSQWDKRVKTLRSLAGLKPEVVEEAIAASLKAQEAKTAEAKKEAEEVAGAAEPAARDSASKAAAESQRQPPGLMLGEDAPVRQAEEVPIPSSDDEDWGDANVETGNDDKAVDDVQVQRETVVYDRATLLAVRVAMGSHSQG